MTTPTPVRLVLAAAAAAVATACVSAARFDGPDGDRRFYEARCGVCHVPFPRTNLGPDQWPRVLDVMAGKAGLTTAQRDRVTRYLTAR